MNKNDALQKLYKAVDAYCVASKAGSKLGKPIPEHYWNAVVIAWKNAKNIIEPEGKDES